MVSSETTHSENLPSRTRNSLSPLAADRFRSQSPLLQTGSSLDHPPVPKLEDLSDEELVARCKSELPHDIRSYEELVRRYESLIFGFCHRSIGSIDDAEEICQDAFLRIFHKIHQFEGRSSFKTWLFRIVVNLCSSRKAALAKRRTRSEIVTEELTNRAHSDSMAHSLEDLSDNLQEAMNRLDEKNREIILMKYVSGLQLDEIAAILSLKISATKMRLYRARDELKAAYQMISQTEVAA